MQNNEWICKKFDDLSAKELYQIMQLRSEVFVVEQTCIYLDADDKDLHAHHLFIYSNNCIAAYARLLPPNIAYPQASIGRVITSPKCRKQGYGILLMKNAIDRSLHLFNTNSIKIGAQLYLKKFYEGFGFIQISDAYDEDGIPHISMLLQQH